MQGNSSETPIYQYILYENVGKIMMYNQFEDGSK